MIGTGTNMFAGEGAVKVSQTDGSGDAILAKGTAANIPSGAAGYAVGCEYIATDTGAHYFNTGTAASCTFVVVGTVTAGSITATELASGAVTLAKLAAGVTPAYVSKFGGKSTWTGSGTSKAITVTGVLSTDIVIATIQTAPTQAAYIVSAAPTSDTVTVTLSAANTSNDAVIAYQVFRAAA